jgi:BlaI family transcriptional regulator, penicillinase repressor
MEPAAAMKQQKARRGRRAVPEAELEVLALLDRLGEIEASALRKKLAPQRPLAHTSVITLLRRLENRGLVRRRRAPQGRAHLYSVSGKSGLASHLRGLAARVFGHDRVRLVSTLFEGEPPSEEELADLRRLIGRLRDREPGGQRR